MARSLDSTRPSSRERLRAAAWGSDSCDWERYHREGCDRNPQERTIRAL